MKKGQAHEMPCTVVIQQARKRWVGRGKFEGRMMLFLFGESREERGRKIRKGGVREVTFTMGMAVEFKGSLCIPIYLYKRIPSPHTHRLNKVF